MVRNVVADVSCHQMEIRTVVDMTSDAEEQKNK